MRTLYGFIVFGRCSPPAPSYPVNRVPPPKSHTASSNLILQCLLALEIHKGVTLLAIRNHKVWCVAFLALHLARRFAQTQGAAVHEARLIPADSCTRLPAAIESTEDMAKATVLNADGHGLEGFDERVEVGRAGREVGGFLRKSDRCEENDSSSNKFNLLES